jgi:hypothetical protein
MTEEEMAALTEKINTYWSNRPKTSETSEKQKLEPLHDFDNLDFTSQEHVDAVRKLYMKASAFAPKDESSDGGGRD